MTPLQNRIVQYLEGNADTIMTEKALIAAGVNVGYSTEQVRTALRGLSEQVAHIGNWWVKGEGNYWCGYTQDALTEKNQTCIDRGANW